MTESASTRFHRLLTASLDEGTFSRMTLGKPRGGTEQPEKILLRLITTRESQQLSFVYRYKTRDVTKNFLPADGVHEIVRVLGHEFYSAHLATTRKDVQLEFNKRGEARISESKSSVPLKASVAQSHDIVKDRFITQDRPWLHDLGVTTADGKLKDGMSSKFRQINRFVELLVPLVDQLKLSREQPTTLVDMGSGKGYLTFAVYDYFSQQAGFPLQVRGIESRPELVNLCNRYAEKSGFDRLRFEAGSIGATKIPAVDIVIALHACDTATDDALFEGLRGGARLLVVAPCCQKELRPQLNPLAPLDEPLRHGIFRERQTEFLTDALRALLLEREGYKTRVFEFITTEHTAKNTMITAVKLQPGPDPIEMELTKEKLNNQIAALKALYGIHHQHLEELLAQ